MKALITKLSYFTLLLIIILFCYPSHSRAQKRTIPSFDTIYTSNFPKSVTVIDCSPDILNGNLVFNPAFNTNSTYDPAHVDNPFAYGHIDFWTNAFSTPNFDFPPNSLPPYPGIHAAFMGSTYAGTQVYSEGLIGKLSPLIPGNEYSLSFYLNTLNFIPANFSHDYNIYLMHCSDAPAYFPNPNRQFLLPSLPPNSQRIFCETNSVTTNWHQVSTCFIPDDDYDMILIFPAITPTSTTPNYSYFIGFAYPEIVARSTFNNIIVNTPDPANPCIKTLAPGYAVNNATYQWYLNGNLFSTFQNPQISTSTQFGNVRLQVTLPNGGTNSSCGTSCELIANINIPQCAGCPQPIVTPNGPIDYYIPLDAGGPIGRILTSNTITGNQWYFNNQAIVGANAQTYDIKNRWGLSGGNQSGNFHVVNNGCQSNTVHVEYKNYGYGNYGEESYTRLGSKVHPILTSNYYCYNTTNNFIQQFNLGTTATYTWNFPVGGGNIANISLTPGSYNPNSNQAQVNVGSPIPQSYTYIQGVADLNGKEIIFDYFMYLSHPDYIPSNRQVCLNAPWYIYNLDGSSYSTSPGGSGFDWEFYDFGANGTIFSGPGAGQSSVLIPGRSTSQQMVVKFTGPSFVQKHFYYNWGGCYKEEYNITLLSGCKSSEELKTIVNIYPNPSTNQITITSTEAISHIEISDLMSPSLKSVKLNGIKSITINVLDLKPGVYNCKITTNKGIENQKIIIKR